MRELERPELRGVSLREMSFRDEMRVNEREREAQCDKRMKKKKGASGKILITRQNKIIFFLFS